MDVSTDMQVRKISLKTPPLLTCLQHCAVVQSLSHIQLFATPWTAAQQASLSFSISQSLLKFMFIELMMPSKHSSSVAPFSCPQSFTASGSFPISRLFPSCGQSVGASASVLPVNFQGWFPLGFTCWSPCCPRDCQESSPAPQFKSINSSALSLLYGPTVISIHDYWKNHSFD